MSTHYRSLNSLRKRRFHGADRPNPLAVTLSAAFALMLGLLPGTVAAWEPAVYELDPVHTRVMFAVGHSGFSKALGTVSGSTGVLVFDPQDWSSARIDVRVPLTRLDLGDSKWNAATLARNLLDGERHPEARFVSNEVIAADGTHARVCGDLNLRGVTRPLCMDVTLNALKRHPMPPFRRTAGFSATATLSRSDFGIDAWQKLIGDDVELRIEAEAVRARRPADVDVPKPPESPAPQEDLQNDSAPAAELLFEDELQAVPPALDTDATAPPPGATRP